MKKKRLPSPIAQGLAGVALAITSGPASADVFRWVDEVGKAHYGDQVPDRYRSSQRKVQPSQAESTAAEAPAPRQKPAPPTAEPVPAGAPAIASQLRPSPQVLCDAEWKRFLDSAACYGPFHVGRGGIRAEAVSACGPAVIAPSCGPMPQKYAAVPIVTSPNDNRPSWRMEQE